LGDEQKKQAYDTYGEASQQPGFDQNPFGAGNPFAGAGGFSRTFTGSGGTVEDLFSTLFGGGPMSGRGRGTTRGDDIEISISVTFMEAAKGTTKTVNVTPVSDCSTCTGTGMKTGKKRTQCPTCRGTGQQTFVLNSGFQMASTCSTCQGAGSTIPRGAECDDCGGVGKIKYRKQVKIEVPPGQSRVLFFISCHLPWPCFLTDCRWVLASLSYSFTHTSLPVIQMP
jgi:molecular chaperone DnaJ